MEINIALEAKVIGGWAYEHAFATQYIWESDEDPEDLHLRIAQQVGARPDNKQTFELRMFTPHSCDPVKMFITFHDGNIYLGLGVRGYHAELPPQDYPKDHGNSSASLESGRWPISAISFSILRGLHPRDSRRCARPETVWQCHGWHWRSWVRL